MEIRKKGFIIYFLARSGSTYITMQIKNHPEVIAKAEVFGARMLPGKLEQTDDNRIKFLRRFFIEHKKESDILPEKSHGFKLQIEAVPKQLSQVGRYIKVINDYDICHFFLYRRNKVKQLISSYRAKQVKAFTKSNNGLEQAHMYKENQDLKQVNFPKIHIEPRYFKKQLINLRKKENKLDQIKTKIDSTIDLFYEDMLENKKEFFEGICTNIGIDPLLLSSEDQVLKITEEDLSKVIENFEEVLKYLQGTEFEEQLLEGSLWNLDQ